MAPHFDCIGVSLTSLEDMMNFVNELVPQVERRVTDEGGEFFLAEDPSGALVGVNVGSEGTVDCVKPSFATTTSVRVVPRGFSEDPDCRFCDRLHVEVVGEDGELAYPLAIQLHDMAVARSSVSLGEPSTASVVGFAEELDTWPDEEAYNANLSDELPLAPEALIPVGLFVDEGRSSSAHVLLTGHIVRAAVRRNEWTGGAFRWAVVRTFGGEYEIVAPVNAPPLEESSIVRGHFWVVGSVAAA
jgi:hypothetical protein